jgi:hypothetical protein
MPFLTRFRLRWARWFSFFTAVCAVAYWAERQYHRQTVAKTVETDSNVPQELEPTLVQAQDVTATALPIHSKPKSSWNLQPQWRTELRGSMGEHSRQAALDATPQLPIPESFPLQPRFKKGPPAIGNAIVDYRESAKPTLNHEPIRQPQSSSLANNAAQNTPPSGLSFSPFGTSSQNGIAQSNATPLAASPPTGTRTSPFVDTSRTGSPNSPEIFDRSNLAATSSNQRNVTATTRFDSSPEWPDQSFAATSPLPPQMPGTWDIATPNLLTNARLQPPNINNPSSNSRSQVPALKPHPIPQPNSQPNPNGSNYIRQPIR